MKRIFRYYLCKSKLIPGHNYATVYKMVRRIYHEISSKTRRRPYIRSVYFGGKKIFLDNFWPHLLQKQLPDRLHRLRYFEGAIELIQKSKIELIQKSKVEPIFEMKERNRILYRFLGRVEDHFFAIQIKEDLKRGQRFLMSMFRYTKITSNQVGTL